MIRIGSFGIIADSYGYAVGKISRYKNKKTGEETEILTSTKYYGSLQGCLSCIRKQIHLKVIKDFDGSLKEAIQALNDADERFEALIEDVEKEDRA